MIKKALSKGITVRAGIQSAFGFAYKGNIPTQRICDLAAEYSVLGVQEINLADTPGLANPKSVYQTVTKVRRFVSDDIALSLHLHDTCGLGIANMVAGLQAGVSIFDTALGGLGGCPFIPHASGNIPTEDAVFALEQIGIGTGIDWEGLGRLALEMEGLLKRTLPSRMAHNKKFLKNV
jgi:hydroxymethylglutaryl-CoA lyase